jgi:FkbM family methyltransferase
MAITAPAFVMKHPYLRKRTRDLWCFMSQVRHGSRFVGRRMGYRLLFDMDGVVDRYVLAFGFYEQEQRTALFAAARELAKAGGPRLFLDIGAHWGVYALWAHSSGLFDRVVAIEADPRNAAQLRANLYLNDLTTAIEVREAAAAAETGQLSFSLGDRFGRVGSKMARLEEQAGHEQMSVPAIRIDDVEPMRGGVVVAKIDVEGAEADVIEGMRGLLSGNRGLLQVEVFEPQLPAVDALMASIGYRRFLDILPDRYYRND